MQLKTPGEGPHFQCRYFQCRSLLASVYCNSSLHSTRNYQECIINLLKMKIKHPIGNFFITLSIHIDHIVTMFPLAVKPDHEMGRGAPCSSVRCYSWSYLMMMCKMLSWYSERKCTITDARYINTGGCYFSLYCINIHFVKFILKVLVLCISVILWMIENTLMTSISSIWLFWD